VMMRKEPSGALARGASRLCVYASLCVSVW